MLQVILVGMDIIAILDAKVAQNILVQLGDAGVGDVTHLKQA